MNPFSAGRRSDASFDDWDAFAPEHLPDPGPFLEGHDVLTADAHVAFHEVARECFEERGVYDATFGYNLAKLNLDRRHPDAGFRYAIERRASDDPPSADGMGVSTAGDGSASESESTDRRVLRAEFTPTTEFCPQGEALTKGAFRAWNGLADRHEFDLVRVRVRPTHYRAGPINDGLEGLEREFLETGTVAERSRSSPF